MEFFSDVPPDYTALYRTIGRAAKRLGTTFVRALSMRPISDGESHPLSIYH